MSATKRNSHGRRRTLRGWIAAASTMLVIAFSAVVLPAQPALAQAVNFPDQKLEAAVAGALGVPAGSVTSDDMVRLTTLTVSKQGIQDLTGLQYATNLTTLFANGNQVTDLTPLAGLTKLGDVNLSENGIVDLSPLSGLTQLRRLSLADNQISDITALASLTSLRTLYLDRNEVADIGPLQGLASLFVLSLGVNHVTDIGPLAGLDSLGTLFLQSNEVVDVSPLGQLANLTMLSIGGNAALADISPLESMTSLKHVYLPQTQVSDAELAHLAGLSGLMTLDLSSDHLTDVGPLATLTNLESLYLQQNEIEDLTPLSAMTKLKVLCVHSNPISDLGPLASLVNLNYLELAGDDISQISALVENAGIGAGDTVGLDFNHLDTHAGSQAMTDIATLVARGAKVTYWGQTPSDVTPPATSVTGADGSWHNHAVTLGFSAQDNAGGSGVAYSQYSTDGGVTWTRGNSVSVAAEGTTTVSYRSVDNAGNVEAAQSVAVKIDTTAPTVTFGAPAEGAVFVLGQAVTATWSASDALSGVDSTVPVGTSATLDTGSLGQKTFTVSATDEAGNSASRTLTYTVAYASSGLMQPVNSDGSSIFKLGSTVPLKFNLTDEAGLPVTGLAPRLYIAIISNDVAGTELEAVSSCQADAGNTFREVTSGQYQFNLSTKGMQSGCWRVRVDLGGGAQIVGYFSLR